MRPSPASQGASNIGSGRGWTSTQPDFSKVSGIPRQPPPPPPPPPQPLIPMPFEMRTVRSSDKPSDDLPGSFLPRGQREPPAASPPPNLRRAVTYSQSSVERDVTADQTRRSSFCSASLPLQAPTPAPLLSTSRGSAPPLKVEPNQERYSIEALKREIFDQSNYRKRQRREGIEDAAVLHLAKAISGRIEHYCALKLRALTSRSSNK